MVGRTNVGGGGGDKYAYIQVTFPAGSTCTATNGTNTLTAPDTSGLYVFGIPEPSSTPETWTFSCTDGTKQKSLTASIESKYQVDQLQIFYARIPPEYQEVEYIQNTDYFSDLILIPETTIFQNTWEIDIEYMPVSGQANSLHFVSIGYYNTISYGPSSSRVYYGINLDGNLGVSLTNGTKATARWNAAGHKVYHDGVEKGTLASNYFTYWNNNCTGLSIMTNNSTSYSAVYGRIYSLNVIDTSNNNVLYEFIPCYLKSNTSRIGFYDTVHETFVYSGHVSKGPDVL